MGVTEFGCACVLSAAGAKVLEQVLVMVLFWLQLVDGNELKLRTRGGTGARVLLCFETRNVPDPPQWFVKSLLSLSLSDSLSS